MSRGFVLCATAGRTTLNGEGLQHEDGHSHLHAMTVPSVRAYDVSFAFELAAIIEDGMHRMFELDENCYYYITLQNEDYPMPPMPEGREGGASQGPLSLPAGGAEVRQARAALGLGLDHAAGVARAADPRRALRRVRPTSGASRATNSSAPMRSSASASIVSTPKPSRACLTSLRRYAASQVRSSRPPTT